MNFISLEKILEKILEWIATRGVSIVIGILILIIGFKIINKVLKKIRKVLDGKNADPTIVRFLDTLLNASIKTLLIMIVVQQFFGISLTGLTAVVASAGVALSLALKGSLSNFAGGFVILLMRPFKVGDFVDVVGYSGTVEKISLFYTFLNTIDNKQVLIPNGLITDSSIVNYSSKPRRRVELTFSVAYEEDVMKVKRILVNIVKNNELILNDPDFFVGISQHGDSAVNFLVRAWCKTEDYWTVYYDLLETVKVKFDEENISIPYPQMDVHLKSSKTVAE